jgi:hypothetical protein
MKESKSYQLATREKEKGKKKNPRERKNRKFLLRYPSGDTSTIPFYLSIINLEIFYVLIVATHRGLF